MKKGRYGIYGGQYISETLMNELIHLEEQYEYYKKDPAFQEELHRLLVEYAGRPSLLYYAEKMTKDLGGAKIYLKREDLNHTGAHKINNVLGQALLAKKMGKTRLIAETGAGQHGVATATAAALFGMECEIFMGKEDTDRQALNVYRMELLGAKVHAVTSGTMTLKDAVNEAMREWSTRVSDTHYVLGSVMGPHPFPMIVRDFQSVISQEARAQILEKEGKLPKAVVACVGGCLIRTSPDTVGSITVDHVERLFNKKFYMYKRPIHEQVLPIDETLTAFCSFDIPLYVDHDGYFSSKEEMDLKAKRNLDILLASEHDYPDSYTYFQIGQSYYIMGDYENACRYFEKGLNFDLSPESEFVQLMIVHYGYSLLNMDRGEDAQLFLEQVYSYFDFLADFLMVIGTVYIRNEHYMKAALQFIKATQTEKFFTLGTNSFRAYYHLGAVYEMIGQPENALIFYEKCGAYDLAQERIKFLKESQK